MIQATISVIKIAIVCHSDYGHTYEVAKHVEIGAKAAGAEVRHYTSTEACDKIDELAGFDAIIFGSPTYMGSVSADFKKFMDSSSSAWAKQKLHNKIAAGFTNSGGLSGDKLSTLIQMAVFAAQHGMIWVGNDVMPTPDGLLNRLGSWLGVMTQSDHGKGPDVAPPVGDRKTAELLGARVASIALKFKKGGL